MKVKSESEVVQSCQHLAKLLRLLTLAIQFLYLPKTDPLSYSFNKCWLSIYYMLASVSEISDGLASSKPHTEEETQALEWDGCGFVAWFCHLLTVSFHQVMSSLFLYTLAFTKITTKNVTIMSISSRAREKEAIAPILWWLQGGYPQIKYQPWHSGSRINEVLLEKHGKICHRHERYKSYTVIYIH